MKAASGYVPHVVVIGCGFGGLAATRALKKAPVQITVIDRTNHHLFQPLLYQVATAGLSAPDIASPIRFMLRKQKNARILLDEVIQVDTAQNYLITQNKEIIPYDYLVIATGAQTSYFGHEKEWARYAIGLKDLDDALEIRRRVLLAFEEAEREPDPEKRQALMSFVVIGGGPTGVEMAGALCELSRHVLRRDFRLIDPAKAKVYLLEAGPRILSTFHEKLSASATKHLAKLGCQVRTGAMVTQIDETGVYLGEEKIPSQCVVWGAGVRATSLTKTLFTQLDKAGRIVVEPDLSLPGHPNVFAIGDTAVFLHQGGKPLPGTSPVAMQQGRAVARSIKATLVGKGRGPFRFFDKGSMATIGRSAAVVESGWFRLNGLLAWLAWLLVHIFFLIGFRNRFIVLFEWFWSYVTFQRGARLITGKQTQIASTEKQPPVD